MKKLLPLILIVLFIVFPGGIAIAQGVINVSVDPSVVLNEDFAQLMGGYLEQGLSSTQYNAYYNSNLRQAVKKILPQDPDHPVVMRVQSGKFAKIDSLNHVRAVIDFCKEVNCDPMFGPLAGDEIGSGPGWEVTEADIREHILFVKNECQRVFGDDQHCRHWNYGNEPTSPPQSCIEFAQGLYQTGQMIRGYIPNAIIHTLELYNYETKVRGTNETIGECILRELDQKTPKLYVDVLQTHWYPYSGNSDVNRRIATDGEEILAYWEGNYGSIQSMLYPYGFVSFMQSYAQKYEVSRTAEIGVGELNLSAMFDKYPQLTEMASDVYGGCCWLRANYEQNLQINGCALNPCLVPTPILPQVCCSGMCQCKIPSNFETKRLNLTWGGAFWYLDELGIMAEAGVKYLQRHGLVSNNAFGIVGWDGARTPASYAYEFLSTYFGNIVVKSDSSGPAQLNAHASLGKNGDLRVLLVNKTATDRPIRLNLSNFSFGTNGLVYFLQAPSNNGLFFKGGDMVGQQTAPVVKEPEAINVGSVVDYRVPAYTSIIINIPKFGWVGGLTLQSGWNNFTWQTSWPVGVNFNELPLACQKVSLPFGDWLKTYVRSFSFQGVFEVNKSYQVWCQNETTW